MRSMKLTKLMSATALIAVGGPALAAEFDGVTLQAKLIGGQQYEALTPALANGRQ